MMALTDARSLFEKAKNHENIIIRITLRIEINTKPIQPLVKDNDDIFNNNGRGVANNTTPNAGIQTFTHSFRIEKPISYLQNMNLAKPETKLITIMT